jgi:hypothetical protein
VQDALKDASAVGKRVDELTRLVRQASEIVPFDEIPEACRFWRDRRPDKPFMPKTVKDATADYLARQGRLSVMARFVLKLIGGHLRRGMIGASNQPISSAKLCSRRR